MGSRLWICVVLALMMYFVLFQAFLLMMCEDTRIREVRLYDEGLYLVITPSR